MDNSTGRRRRFDITRRARVPAIALSLGLILLVIGAAPGVAQSIDSTIEEQLQEHIESDVASTLEAQVESDVAATVEDQVQAQVESELADTLEQQVEEQVQSDVAATVEDQVQAQVESDVAGTVEAQVQSQVESAVTRSVEARIESGVAGAVEQQIESGVVETIEQALARGLGGELDDRELDALVEQLAELAEELGIEDVGAAIEAALDAADPPGGNDETDGGDGAGDGGAAEEEGTESYVAGLDALGRAAENDVWVILVPAEFTARIQDWGFAVREQRDLDALGRVLLRVDAPGDRDIAQAALELALDAPGTSVDFNHVYRANAEQAAAAGTLEAAGRVERGVEPGQGRAAGLEIGIVDSRVAADHESLAFAELVQQDFVPFAGHRPTGHGTAVASILIGDSPAMHGVLRGARLHAASVIFTDEAGNEIASASSLVSALEWLAAGNIGVVNMSLAGPPNRVLETAIDAATQRGAVVVAAVGNNGPNGEPLYPAAYDHVVGVTAVDATHRVYHYANRGRQVMFSAPGVDVPVANIAGGYARQSGTSMAAPHAAAIITQSLAAQAALPDGVLASLQAAAIDLGEKNFDETYGFGLISAVDE